MNLERGSAPYGARNHTGPTSCRFIPTCESILQPGGCCGCDFNCAFLFDLADKLNDGEHALPSRNTGRSCNRIN